MFCRTRIIVAVAACLFLFLTPSAMANIREEYREMEEMYKKLVAERREHENETKKLEERLKTAEKHYLTCTSGEWWFLWKVRMRQAENARNELEAQNKQLGKLNRTLEETNSVFDIEREELDRTYQEKGSAYETALRKWMSKFRMEYCLRLEQELFKGYSEYRHGIEKYLIFVDQSTKACIERNYTQAIVELAAEHIQEIVRSAVSIGELISKIKRL